MNKATLNKMETLEKSHSSGWNKIECAQIDSGAYVPQIEKLQNILENIEIELSGESTAAYLMK